MAGYGLLAALGAGLLLLLGLLYRLLSWRARRGRQHGSGAGPRGQQQQRWLWWRRRGGGPHSRASVGVVHRQRRGHPLAGRDVERRDGVPVGLTSLSASVTTRRLT